MLDRRQIVQLVESLRSAGAPGGPASKDELQRIDVALAPYSAEGAVAAFRSDLAAAMDGDQNVKMANTQQAVAALDEDHGMLVGIFKSPYNTNLALDAMAFTRIKRPSYIPEKFVSSAVPVSVTASTSGFASPRNVAIFMEELQGVDVSNVQDDKAIYLIDRFARRSLERTRPFALALGAGRVFELFRDMTPAQATSLNAGWVWLHEHFHRSGPLPLPRFLHLKNTRSGGAFEELRVDLNAIMTCLSGEIAGDRGADLANFILAERLLRYGAETHPAKDYDGRSSNLLLGLLRASGASLETFVAAEISATSLAPHLATALERINQTDERASRLPANDARRTLQQFVLEHLNLDSQGEILAWPPFELLKTS